MIEHRHPAHAHIERARQARPFEGRHKRVAALRREAQAPAPVVRVAAAAAAAVEAGLERVEEAVGLHAPEAAGDAEAFVSPVIDTALRRGKRGRE